MRLRKALLAVAALQLAAPAFVVHSRNLLQADADVLGTDQLAPIFQLVSNNTNTFTSSDLPFLESSLEMDTDASFSTNWRAGPGGDWQDGQTRWNVTVEFADRTLIGQYMAALHTVVCSEITEATLYEPPANVSLTGVLNVTAGQANFTAVFPVLIDYDGVQSVAIYSGFQTAGQGFVGCSNMIPPPPDFPSDWSALVEANFANWGLTFTTRQLYSQTLNKARMDLSSFQDDKIIIADYGSGNFTFISPANATYPHGVCNTSQIPDFFNWMTDDSNTSLLDTSSFLRFDYDKVQFSPGHESIRGIECEKWTYDSRRDSERWAGNYTTTFYFPINQWRIGRQDYHRLLKEIHVTGTLDDGREVDNRFEYVNFKPQNYTTSAAAFDVCAFAPQGVNCNCTRQRIAALAGLRLDSDPDGVTIDNSTQADQSGNCELMSASIPHGFVSQQAGPYVGLVIIGMVAGALFSFLGTWLYYRRIVGVQANDRMGHTKFGVDGM